MDYETRYVPNPAWRPDNCQSPSIAIQVPTHMGKWREFQRQSRAIESLSPRNRRWHDTLCVATMAGLGTLAIFAFGFGYEPPSEVPWIAGGIVGAMTFALCGYLRTPPAV